MITDLSFGMGEGAKGGEVCVAVGCGVGVKMEEVQEAVVNEVLQDQTGNTGSYHFFYPPPHPPSKTLPPVVLRLNYVAMSFAYCLRIGNASIYWNKK